MIAASISKFIYSMSINLSDRCSFRTWYLCVQMNAAINNPRKTRISTQHSGLDHSWRLEQNMEEMPYLPQTIWHCHWPVMEDMPYLPYTIWHCQQPVMEDMPYLPQTTWHCHGKHNDSRISSIGDEMMSISDGYGYLSYQIDACNMNYVT